MNGGASLHMMSKNALTSGERENTRKEKETAVIMTANGKAATTEEATVYVDDVDVFVTVMLLEDSPAVISLGFLCEGMGYSHEWKQGGLSITD